MQSRIVAVMAGALVALAAAIPSYAQGKGGSKGKGPTRPPSSGAVSTQSTSSSTSVSPGAAAATPFAWMDDASVMEPGNVWVGVSMARWQGASQSHTIFPGLVVDAAVGWRRAHSSARARHAWPAASGPRFSPPGSPCSVTMCGR